MEREQIIREANDRIFKSKSYTDKRKHIPTNNLIFIYTPPKVGSTTLVSSIRISASHLYSVFHIHDDVMFNVLTGINDITVNELIQYNAKIGKNVYVIDVYRTPIERKISEYFEKLGPIHFNNVDENLNTYNIRTITERFNNLFPHIGNGDYYFEKYGISTPDKFDFKKKYLLHIENGVKYIKLRLNDSKDWGKILTEIFGIEIVIVEQYQTQDKSIGNIFKKFKSEYKLPINFFESIQQCKYLDFYYTSEEKYKYLSEWKNKLTTIYKPFSLDEYNFYLKISLENKYINDLQTDHYIDYGCLCMLCCKKRNEIFINFKKKIPISENDKVIHNQLVSEDLKNKTNIIHQINNINNKNNRNIVDNKFMKSSILQQNSNYTKQMNIKNLMIR